MRRNKGCHPYAGQAWYKGFTVFSRNTVNIADAKHEDEQMFSLNICSSRKITLVSFEISLEIARQHCHFAVTDDEPITVRENADPKKDRHGL